MAFDYSSLPPDIWRDIAGFIIQNGINEDPSKLPDFEATGPWAKLSQVMGLPPEVIRQNVFDNLATGPIWGDRFDGDDEAREQYLRDRAIWMPEIGDALGVPRENYSTGIDDFVDPGDTGDTGGSSTDTTAPKIYDPSVLSAGSSFFGIPYSTGAAGQTGVATGTDGTGGSAGTVGQGLLPTNYFSGSYGSTNYFPALAMAGLSSLGGNMSTNFGNLLSGLFGAGTDLYMNRLNAQDLEAAQGSFRDLVNTGMNRVDQSTSFTPFTITGASGSGSAIGSDGNFGGFGLNYTPETMARIQQAMGTAERAAGASQAINAPNIGLGYQGTGPTAGLTGLLTAQDVLGTISGQGRGEEEIFRLLENMQQPDRERERLMLRDELLGQGRLGTQTAAFGGTPEELARAKAVEEARSTNAFNAFQLAGQEQDRLARQALSAYGLGEQAAGRVDSGLLSSRQLGNQFNLGLGGLQNQLFANQIQQALGQGQLGNEFYRSSFLPQQQLLDELGLGADMFEIAQRGGIEGARIGAGLFEGLLESETNFMTEFMRNKQAENALISDILLGSGSGTAGGTGGGGLFGFILDNLFDRPTVPGQDAYLPGALPR